MKIKAVVHEAEEGGFWAEVPAIPGCASQGETMDELMQNLREAIEGCLSAEVPSSRILAGRGTRPSLRSFPRRREPSGSSQMSLDPRFRGDER